MCWDETFCTPYISEEDISQCSGYKYMVKDKLVSKVGFIFCPIFYFRLAECCPESSPWLCMHKYLHKTALKLRMRNEENIFIETLTMLHKKSCWENFEYFYRFLAIILFGYSYFSNIFTRYQS